MSAKVEVKSLAAERWADLAGLFGPTQSLFAQAGLKVAARRKPRRPMTQKQL